jgi:hypothetical protein
MLKTNLDLFFINLDKLITLFIKLISPSGILNQINK